MSSPQGTGTSVSQRGRRTDRAVSDLGLGHASWHLPAQPVIGSQLRQRVGGEEGRGDAEVAGTEVQRDLRCHLAHGGTGGSRSGVDASENIRV